jgi:hypothetical protein
LQTHVIQIGTADSIPLSFLGHVEYWSGNRFLRVRRRQLRHHDRLRLSVVTVRLSLSIFVVGLPTCCHVAVRKFVMRPLVAIRGVVLPSCLDRKSVPVAESS